MRSDPDTAIGGCVQRFPSTRRSLLSAVGRDGVDAREALGAIIEMYWKAAYIYIRLKWNCDNEEAKDLVQGFFAGLIEGGVLERFDSSRASFRTFLRLCLDRHVMKQNESAGRLKRGGAAAFVPLDFEGAEREVAFADRTAPSDELFHREWQRRVLSLAIEDLRAHSADAGKQAWFRLFEQYDLAEEPRPRYEDLAAEHNLTVAAVTNALACARRELRRLALARLATVTRNQSELRAEARQLFG